MKKVALIFGLSSGAVAVAVMLLSIRMMNSLAYRRMELVGYTGLVLSALLVFFGIRSFREKAAGGKLTFGRGLAVGLLISLVSTLCYITAFELASFVFIPGLGEKYAACMVKQARDAGASPEKLRQTEALAATMQRLWSRPATLAAVSFAESYPVGAIASLLSAAILRRK